MMIVGIASSTNNVLLILLRTKYAAMCQDVTQQVMGSSLSGNMLICQASVSGSGQRSFCLANASMALVLSAHTPWVQFSVSC